MNQKCKRLGNQSTKRDLAEAHRTKMEMKNVMNEHNSRMVGDRSRYTLANLSVNHEHFGDTPAEHDKRKHTL